MQTLTDKEIKSLLKFDITKSQTESDVVFLLSVLHKIALHYLEEKKLTPDCYIWENRYSKSVEIRRPSPIRVIACYYYGGDAPVYTLEEAYAAAQTECDRLNSKLH